MSSKHGNYLYNKILQLLYCITFSRKKQYLNIFKNAKNIALLQYFFQIVDEIVFAIVLYFFKGNN